MTRSQINIRVTEEEKEKFNILSANYKSVSDYIKKQTIEKQQSIPHDPVEAINNLIEKYRHIKELNKSDILFNTKINQKISVLKEVIRDIQE